ncbi:uncharacterized protein LOC116016476 isoform X1 [Ipomoea triloba]|uniref:uncharacterized protein LOC116016476 isoform X1 n=1 Tax=Ipomoea triloba TaxID=35885 RepID=UPI00125D42C3|nr:uncharacterized protein LOC116016476 isoform X1 [Ipomoea triloba]
MDEYLQCMKTLRSQMNDVEDQATKISVEEQMQLTTVQTLEGDLNSVKRQTIQLKEDIDKMVKAKGEICSLILEKRRKISSLEGNSSTLYQTLELSQQERTNLSTKLLEKRKYYSKVAEDITTHLKEQQNWIDDHRCGPRGSFIGVNSQAMDTIFKKTGETEVYQDNAVESLSKNFEAANTKLSQLKQLKFELDLENTKLMQSAEFMKKKINDFKPELREMDVKFLEDEHQALSGDKVELTEYVQSLQFQIVKLKVSIFLYSFLANVSMPRSQQLTILLS